MFTYNKKAYLFITNKCNEKCYDCANHNYMKNFNGKISFNKIKDIDLKKYNQIYLTGGEPGLLSKEIKDELAEYFFNNFKEQKFTILTNGTNVNEWNEKFHKIIHIVNFDNIVMSKRSTYTIVINKKSNLDEIKKCVDKFKKKLTLKNDCFDPFSKQGFNNILKNLGLNIEYHDEMEGNYKNFRTEKADVCKTLAPKGKNIKNFIFDRKISVYKKCMCTWYNCLDKI